MTCIDCEQPRLVMPDNISLRVYRSAGQEYVAVDTNPNGRTVTAWCVDHFPSWLWGTHRVPRTKPHIPATEYVGMAERMREAAQAGAEAARHLVEAFGGESA